MAYSGIMVRPSGGRMMPDQSPNVGTAQVFRSPTSDGTSLVPAAFLVPNPRQGNFWIACSFVP
jgi:hypothetical protein